MSRWHADNWGHLGHYLVDPYTWPWPPNGHSHGHEWPTPTHFVQCQPPPPPPPPPPPILKNSYSKIWPWKSMIKVMCDVCGRRWRSLLTLKIQRSRSWSRSNPLVTFEVLEFNWYVSFSFLVNRATSGWDIANSISSLNNSRLRS